VPLLHRAGLHLGWALVLAALVSHLVAACPPGWRRAAVLGVAVLALVPGPSGPTYWLGLAFQLPSLSAMGLALWWLMGPRRSAVPHATQRAWALGIAALGWVLLLDTLALLPWPLYRLGYGQPAVAVLLLLTGWLASTPASRRSAWVLGVVTLVFVLTRLPSGNLWDALCDPWLWLAAQLWLARSGWRRATPLGQ
jgi:hypothetical protein